MKNDYPINTFLSDLVDSLTGNGLNYEREFSANTRTSLSKELIVNELNFQYGRPELISQ